MDLERFRQLPLLGILRGLDESLVPDLVESAVGAGLETIEITMNTPGAAEIIRRTVASAGGRLMVGAGTVLSVPELEQALAAGATFIVMPTLVREVVESCRRRAVPVFPGALTPQEIHAAWSAGATMVKVFPAKLFGPEYFTEIKGPFRDVELLACGGVNADSIGPFFAAGASAVAFGASVFRQDWLAARAFDRITASIERLVAAYRAVEKRRAHASTGLS
jgi:2-dehydro-3-deoxyphosphogluconate aldolase/(4S)-4-hydroxy-2-oxoglutarate aldolase